MKKNVKNKILAFSMASAMIVPNVAVVFAEAPKAGLASVAKEVKTYSYKINLIDNETNQKIADGDLPFNATGDQTYDITPFLNFYGVELADIDSYKGIDAANFPFTVNPDGAANVKDIYVSTKKEEVKTYSYKINLIDNETNQKIADGDLTFNATGDQTYDITPILSHYGVELADINGYKGIDAANFPFTVNKDGAANVKDIYVSAKKEEVKTYSYKINLIDNKTNQKLADGDLVFNAVGDQTYDITPILNHYGVELADINGYKGVDAANFPFTVNEDGVANVKDIYVSAKKEEVKTYSYKINLIDSKTNQKLADGDLVFNAAGDQTYDITPVLKHYGVKLADLDAYKGVDAANFPFTVNEDGAANVKDIYVTADTQYTTTLSVTFITSDDTVVGEKTFEKTTDNDADVVFGLGTDITLPEGYHWVDYNDQIKDVTLPAGSTGGHYMYVSANDEEVKTYSYKINLIDNETNQKLADGELVFDAAGDQTYDITPILNHYGVELADIDGYNGVDAANFPFTVNEDGAANVKDIYVSTKNEEVKTYSYKINLIDNETNQKLADGELVFNAAGDQTYDITPILKHYGVKLADLDAYKDVDAANFPFTVNEDGVANVKDIYVEQDDVAPTPTEDPKKDDTKKDDPKKEETKKDDPKKEETKKPSKTADTADTSDVAAYAIPLVMSMVAISAIVVGKKKLS